ncbi:MAG: hypothetical protein JJD97_09955 [Gemmatimonadaceae bacterium]|nr:hypothetical protein [Gemmatimonadaceae bacterium]
MTAMYSLTHVHLLLNHFPIIVTMLGLLLVAVAMWRRSDFLARVALYFFVGGALSALPTYLTGDSAEETVLHMPGVTRALIESHSDAALISAIFVGVLGVFALWALWRFRATPLLPAWVVRVALVASIIGSGLMSWTGLLGGQVRHTEVRSDFVPPPRPAGPDAPAAP